MKRLFTKYGIAVLSLAVVIAVLLSVMAFFSSTSAVMPNLAGVIATPFRAAGAAIAERVDSWMQYLTDFDELKAENAELKQKLAEMEASIRQAEYDREENKLFRELLELREQRRDLYFEAARIVQRDTSNWSSVFTISKGTAHDVAVGDCVITAEGFVVGVVTEAGLTWSTVRTILDSEASIGALIVRSNTNAVAAGEFSLMHEGLLQLSYLGSDPDLMVGDLIVTSGLGGYFPPQLVIGYVQEIRSSDDGLMQTAIILPSVCIEDLTEVFVITDFNIVE